MVPAHNRPAGDQLPESFLMVKCVTRSADRSVTRPDGRTAPDNSISVPLLDLSDLLLLQADLVRKSGMCVDLVQAFTEHWDHDDSHCQQHCEPEVGRLHQRCGCPNVRVDKRTTCAVENKSKYEVDDNATPDDKVIESCPVESVQATLQKRKSV